MDWRFAREGLLPTWYRNALRLPLTLAAVTSLTATLLGPYVDRFDQESFQAAADRAVGRISGAASGGVLGGVIGGGKGGAADAIFSSGTAGMAAARSSLADGLESLKGWLESWKES